MVTGIKKCSPWGAFLALLGAFLCLACRSSREATVPEPVVVTRAAPGGSPFDLVWLDELGLWVGATEVTWDEYLAFCAWDRPLDSEIDGATRPSKPLDVHPYDRTWGAGSRPAVGMSRRAAQAYCEWLSDVTGERYRLPTEAEWEAFAGSPKPRQASAWFERDRTEPVATKQPNDLGLYDVYGNLWEYCSDGWSAHEPERPVLRGGSWRDRLRQVSLDSRLAFEDDWTLDDPGVPPGWWWIPSGEHLGFRIVREGD